MSFNSNAIANEVDQKTNLVLGNNPNNKFTYYEPNYFIFGKDDLKLQISGKYRLAKSFNLYLAFTQTMFWNIYVTSQPFKDINYNPEFFYRLVEDNSKNLKSIDFGFIHSSNGKDGPISRSFNRLFLKTNYATSFDRHSIIGEFKFYDIVTHEDTNYDIKKYLGYWDFTLHFTHLIVHQKQRLDLELRVFAGDKVFNFSKGGRSLGLIYNFESENFSPSVYLQYYSGHAENFLNYNKTSEQVRLGLLFFL
jgi:outer membrane phospholipase A